MTTVPTVSVIIPTNHSHHDLVLIVDAICRQTIKPAEIIIIDSSSERGICPSKITELCAVGGIELFYEHRGQAMPGRARNIGLGIASAELIAFIDVQTIPRLHWLEASLMLLSSEGAAGVFGGTSFSAETSTERLVRDAFHGVLPRQTLPGSVFRREVFLKVGQFIDWVRAGEDTEWMLRLELLKLSVLYPPSALVDYVGLIGIDIKKLTKKWYRNYTACHVLPHFFPQKIFLWLILYPMLIFVAYNWNYLLANWRVDSPLFIHHVTKITALLPPLFYVFMRGILLPLRRGVRISRLLPIRFIQISLICLMADSVKALVFSVSRNKCDSRIEQ